MEVIASNAEDTKYSLNWKQFSALTTALALKIDWTKYDSIFPVLRGGLYAAVDLSLYSGAPIVWELPTENIKETLVVDDVCDSGETLEPYMERGFDTAVVHFKERSEAPTYYAETSDKWIIYPWETSKDVESLVTRQIEFIGDSTTRSGLEATPRRVVKSWGELYRGYNESPKTILETRFDVERTNAENAPVVLRDIEFYSTCEHHLLPFYGSISLGYIPGNKVVGISKLARLVDCFARRLQIQERLCEQIADAIQNELNPYGVYVEARARHLCMIARGVAKQNAEMVSVATRGNYAQIQSLLRS